MLTGLHILLSYTCLFECDHCFVYSGPEAGGTFTPGQIRQVLDEAEKIGTIEWIYFEGGEAFLFYPLLVESIREARARGFQVGVVTNAYFATDEETAALWLRPLVALEIGDLSISDDVFHFGEESDNAAKRALRAAQQLGLPAGAIALEAPGEKTATGDVMFRGRAAEKLAAGLPRRPWTQFTKCPYEDMITPSRVHLDAYGHVHLCQGISMGSMWETPLSALIAGYDAGTHPICGPLAEGGPAHLAQIYTVPHEAGYIDACHFCYLVRRALRERFPQHLAPGQVYGLKPGDRPAR